MRGTRTATTALVGTALVGMLLTACTAFGGDDGVPEPTRQAAGRRSPTRPAPRIR